MTTSLNTTTTNRTRPPCQTILTVRHEFDMKSFLADMHRLRKLRGWNLSQLCRECGISRVTLGNLDHSTHPNHRTMQAICDTLDIHVDDYLIKSDDGPCPEVRMLAALRDMGVAENRRHTLVQLALQLALTCQHNTTGIETTS